MSTATFTNSLDAVRKQIEFMKENRREQYDTAKEIHKHGRHGKNVLVPAEEKSGKRVLVEILSLLDWKGFYKHGGEQPVNVYVTGLLRNDCKVQLEEMETDYGVQSFALCGKKGALECLVNLDRMGTMRSCKIHIDECDYASGGKQALSVFWKAIKIREGCTGVLYSATPQECTLSKEMLKVIKTVPFVPCATYRGAEWYLDSGLVHKSEPFWMSEEKKWTEHGQGLINTLIENSHSPDAAVCNRRVGVVRLQSNRSCKDYPDCQQTMNGKEHGPLNILFVDEKNSFEWGNREAWLDNCCIHNRDRADDPKALLIVICATCTRSTELAGHEFLQFWHDNRSLDTHMYSTLSQALGRIKHYSDSGNPIQVYSDPRVFQINSKRLSIDDVKRVAGRTKCSVVKGDSDTGVNAVVWEDCETGGTPLMWKTGNTSSELKTKIVPAEGHEGKWASYDGKFRCMDNCPTLAGRKGGKWWKVKRNVLVYRSPTSSEWAFRTYRPVSEDSEVVSVSTTDAPMKYSHSTSNASMYERIDDTPPPDLSSIDIDILGMTLTRLKDTIRRNPLKKRGDLSGGKAELQKKLHDIRRR